MDEQAEQLTILTQVLEVLGVRPACPGVLQGPKRLSGRRRASDILTEAAGPENILGIGPGQPLQFSRGEKPVQQLRGTLRLMAKGRSDLVTPDHGDIELKVLGSSRC